ncbi:MAG TPA: hypothetical protein VGG48_01765 [Rhizomicrobium sp.]
MSKWVSSPPPDGCAAVNAEDFDAAIGAHLQPVLPRATWADAMIAIFRQEDIEEAVRQALLVVYEDINWMTFSQQEHVRDCRRVYLVAACMRGGDADHELNSSVVARAVKAVRLEFAHLRGAR